MLEVLAVIAVLALASARLTRIVVGDTISIPALRYIVGRLGAGHPIVTLLHCPWCFGWWVSVALVSIAAWFDQIPAHPVIIVMSVPAVAQLAALIRARTEPGGE